MCSCDTSCDEIAIRQQVEWDGQKFQGYIDMGTGLDDDSMPLAKEALTFMVVAANAWSVQLRHILLNHAAT